jgi:hypothetical protein
MSNAVPVSLGRRELLKATALAARPGAALAAATPTADRKPSSYPCLGRTPDYLEFRIIDPGRSISRIETWTQGSFGIARVTTGDGKEGYGQLSPFEPDITATVLHRQVAPQVMPRGTR